jgi:hypothetical protein
MKYALLIYTDENMQGQASEAELRDMYAAYGAFTGELQAAGKLGPAEELASSTQARSVRIRDGRPIVTDGPFADTREQLGGIYIIDADSVDEAVTWAAKVPSAARGVIEVRPLASGSNPGAG